MDDETDINEKIDIDTTDDYDEEMYEDLKLVLKKKEGN